MTFMNNYYKEFIIVLLLTALSSMVWVGQYVRRDLWDQDEARYTYVAWEMDKAGSWFVPVRNGEPYTHKPPLMFWLVKVGSLFTNGKFNSISGRLPSLLGAILALFAFWKLALLWFDSRTAWHSVFILITSSLFWAKGGTGQIDMLLLGLEMIALYFLFSADVSPARWRHILAFSFMGLAILAKGPVGLIIPIGIYLFSNLAGGNIRKVLGWHWLWGIPLALSFPICWLLLAKLNGAPDSYFNELLFKQNIDRFAGKFGGHVRPFYFYLPYLFTDFLPWTFFLPGSVFLLKKSGRDFSRVKSLMGWVLFVILFFSLCQSKRQLYILSVYPALSLMVAAALSEWQNFSQRWQQSTVYPLLIAMGLTSAGALIAPWFLNFAAPYWIFLFLGLLLLGGGVTLFQQFQRVGLTIHWLHFAVGIFLVTELYLGTALLPAFNQVEAPKLYMEKIKKVLPENQPLLLYRMNGEIFSLYSQRLGKKAENLETLLQGMKEHHRGVVLFKMSRWNEVQKDLEGLGKTHKFTIMGDQFCWLEYEIPINIKKL